MRLRDGNNTQPGIHPDGIVQLIALPFTYIWQSRKVCIDDGIQKHWTLTMLTVSAQTCSTLKIYYSCTRYHNSKIRCPHSLLLTKTGLMKACWKNTDNPK